MIIRRRLDLARIAWHLGPYLAVLLAYDVGVTALYVFGWQWVSIGALPLPLLGSAIALIITFRNNAAYDRWWEARGLWGAVVNNSRSFARGLLTLTDDLVLQQRLVGQQIAYALALRCSLLKLSPWEAVERYVPPDGMASLRQAVNLPAAIQNAMGRELATARRSGQVDSIGAAALDRTLSDLANAQGGLERIKKTPLPRQYNQFPQVFVGVYCLLLPVGLVQDLGILTPVGSTIIGFMFLALDRIGRDLEDPFEGTVHDIPMQAITRTIEIDLLQAVDMGPVPEPAGSEAGVLW
jgi:putative membrane protein